MTTTTYDFDRFSIDLARFATTYIDELLEKVMSQAKDLYENELFVKMVQKHADHKKEYETHRVRYALAVAEGNESSAESYKLLAEGERQSYKQYEQVMYEILCK